jgi:methionine-rich copper-binding protein CopC
VESTPPVLLSGREEEGQIILTFSEEVFAGTGTIQWEAGGEVYALAIDSPQVTIDGATLTLLPDPELRYGGHYTVSLCADAVRDWVGNSFPGSGASDLFQFTVRDIDVGDTVAGAAQVSSNQALHNQIDDAYDVDWYAITVQAGLLYTFSLQGEPSQQGTLADPLLTLLDGSGTVLAINDDYGALHDSRIVYAADAETTLYLSAAGYEDEVGSYTLTILQSDQFSDIGATTDTARPLEVGVPFASEVEMAGDEDWFVVSLQAGMLYTFDLQGASSGQGTLWDTYLELTAPEGTLLAANDDHDGLRDSRILFSSVDDQVVYVRAHGYYHYTGSYLLSLQAVPDETAPVLLSAVAIGSQLTLTFSEPIRAGSGHLTIVAGAESIATIAIEDLDQVQLAGHQVTVQLAAPLSGSAQYGVALDEHWVEDGARLGNAVTRQAVLLDVGQTISSAAPFAANGTVNSAIDYGQDSDWFAFSYTAGLRYTFSLLGAASGAGSLTDSYLEWRAADGTLLLENDDANGSLESELFFTPTSNGSGFLVARAYGENSGSYTLRMTAQQDTSPPQLLSADADQGALTLLFDEALQLGVGEIIVSTGQQSYHLSVQEQSEVSLEGALVRLQLGVALQDQTTYAITYTAGVVLDQAGNAVTERTAATAVTVTIQTDIGTGVEEARAMSVGLPVGSRLEQGGDSDWFAVSLLAGVSYQLDLQGSGAGKGTLSDPLLTLYDASATFLDSNDDTIGRDAQLTFTPAESGVYYLEAQGYGSNSGSYTLTVQLTPDLTPPQLLSWQIVGAHLELVFDEYLTLGAGMVQLSDGGQDQRNLAISDGSQVAVLGSRVVIDFAEPLVQGQHYTLEMTADSLRDLSGNPFAGFAVPLTFVASHEVGDSPASASTALLSSAQVQDEINTAGDHDWFTLSLQAGMRYVWTVQGADSGQGTLADPVLILHNAAGQELFFSDDGLATLAAQVIYSPTEDGLFYLEVQGYGAQSGSYVVQMQSEPQSSTSTVAWSLSQLDGVVQLQGGEAGDAAGVRVSFAGDFNGDQYDDLIVAAPGADPAGHANAAGQPEAGVSYLLFGSAELGSHLPAASQTAAQRHEAPVQWATTNLWQAVLGETAATAALQQVLDQVVGSSDPPLPGDAGWLVPTPLPQPLHTVLVGDTLLWNAMP